MLERRPVKFAPDEQRLYDLGFSSFAPRDFLKLLKIGEWRNSGRGDKVLSRGAAITEFMVPISGEVAASSGKKKIVTLHPGELIAWQAVPEVTICSSTGPPFVIRTRLAI